MVEGAKSVDELLKSDFKLVTLVCTQAYFQQQQNLINKLDAEVEVVSESELVQLGLFQTNASVLAVASMRKEESLMLPNNQFVLALDDIRDPGNLGTIIRIADWYGITKIIASPQTADFYNPKVINATMGSFCRVKVWYLSLPPALAEAAVPVYGTFLDGADVHAQHFGLGGILVVGNEANGISHEVARHTPHRITIPRRGGAESLNAAVATAIVLDNIFRLQY